jgi:hypothetical protein
VFHQTRNKLQSVQNFVLKLVNNNCPDLKALIEGDRGDKRINLTLVVIVVPLTDGKPRLDEAFYAATQDISVSGVGIVLDRQEALDDAIVGFRNEGDITFLRTKAKHITPMGGGFYRLGLELTEVVANGDYYGLGTLRF